MNKSRRTGFLRFVSKWFILVSFFALPALAKPKVKEGQPFPPFILKSLDGKMKVDSAKFKGKVVIVDFWASWCEPCKVELPALNKIYGKYKSRGLEIVGINVDETPDLALSFLKSHPVQFPNVWDEGNKFIQPINITKMPTSFIIDKAGKVHHVHEAFAAGDEKKIEQTVVQLLKAK